MQDSKLLKALQQLDPKERKLFHEFVWSPYFNKHEKVCQLADILIVALQNMDKEPLTKSSLFARLFPKEAYHEQKLADLFTYLYRLLERFLAQLAHEEAMEGSPIPLLSQLRKHQLNPTFEKRLDKAKNLRPNLESDELQWYYYTLEKEADHYFTALDSRTHDKSVERKALALDRFYLLSKLRACCEMVNRQNIIKQQYRIDLLRETMDIAKRHSAQYADVPQIGIYLTILKCLLHPNEEMHYQALIKQLKSAETDTRPEELRAMYDQAQNYCIKKINTGKREYLREIFELYRTLLGNGLIFINSQLSQWDYKNIVTTGSRLGEYDWTEQFIHQYKEKLPEAERENAYAFNLATFLYTKKDYGKALRLLQSVEFTDLYYGLGARSLLLKVYYEADDFDPLYSLCNAFKIYLRRNQLVSEYQYRAHMNLVKLTKQLTDIRIKSISSRKETLVKDLGKLRHRMKVAGDITNAAWLEEQVAALATSRQLEMV
ncbi:MAG: hypothetical protein SFW35_00610 [Chitinophagales bacterium]|nr:hypothetical protein [Chitinophagales bacterium]